MHESERPASRRALISTWLFRLLAWDGVLPAVVWSAPFLVRWLFPNNRGAVELTAIFLPVAAFIIRLQVGRCSISSNNLPTAVRRPQVCALCIGLLLLALIDCFMILTHIMPRGAGFVAARDLIIWAVLFLVYLAAMAFALYPGRSRPAGTIAGA